jgi:membrane-bound lytic murein transglycosylase B
VRRPAGIVALLLLLAACSSDKEAAVTTTTSSTSTSTTTTVTTTTTTTAPALPPVAAADAAGLAVQATTAESAIGNPNTTPDALLLAGWTEQVVSRTIAASPALLPDVLGRMPAEFRAALEADTKAAIELRALTKPRTELPPWRIVAPAPADELVADYKAAEQAVGVPWQYLAAIHFVETKLGRIRGTSTAGAQGPMQFLPATWSQYGEGGDINSNRDAIFAAARLLKHNGAPGRIDDALYSYNHSDRYVQAIKLYAGRMKADERAFRGYHQWQVYYRMVDGDRVLPEGYPDRPALTAT